jgi:two-component system OmpR family sensor kinase
MSTPLTQRLYLRIWLAVIAAVIVLTLLFAWLWRWEAEHERSQRPGREIVLRSASGEIIGQAVAPAVRVPGQGLDFVVPTTDGKTVIVQLPRPNRPPPMFAVPWWRPPFDFVWLLALVALAVSLGTYPIVRRLTKRLEALQQGVDRWGQGDLSHRLPEQGQDEVAFLAQRFNVAAERVQALLLAHKALLANASHELRSPLTRIRMGLELMGAHPTSDSKDEIARNIRELDLLIDEILLASRLDASPIDIGTLEPVDLVGLCAEECAQAEAELDVQTGQPSLLVLGVAKLLHRVVRNLLDNARRYASGEVTLSLQRSGALAVIRVCDHGPGVPPDLRERIFEPFYRLPGASEREGGVGLGLALVKSIAQRLGGSVRCEERPGGGACFVVELPVQ